MDLGDLVRRSHPYRNRFAIRTYRLLRRGASRLGLQVVLKTFYSPIPEVEQLPPGAFERASPLAGVRFELESQLQWTRSELGPSMAEFVRRANEPGLENRYERGTTTYSLLDATVLWAMMRRLRPRRVVELGSGASTLVTAEALELNTREGSPAELEVFDPFPGLVRDGLRGLTRVHRRRAQDAPFEVFDGLGERDVLFVDTTHTVKMGSDVNFVVLEVLPRLAPGVVVHFHDIFLPYEYPRAWLEDYGLYWNEQYLVQAFLSLNPGYEVLCAIAALSADHRDEFQAILPAAVAPIAGGAFWIRRRASRNEPAD